MAQTAITVGTPASAANAAVAAVPFAPTANPFRVQVGNGDVFRLFSRAGSNPWGLVEALVAGSITTISPNVGVSYKLEHSGRDYQALSGTFAYWEQ